MRPLEAGGTAPRRQRVSGEPEPDGRGLRRADGPERDALADLALGLHAHRAPSGPRAAPDPPGGQRGAARGGGGGSGACSCPAVYEASGRAPSARWRARTLRQMIRPPHPHGHGRGLLACPARRAARASPDHIARSVSSRACASAVSTARSSRRSASNAARPKQRGRFAVRAKTTAAHC